MQPIPNPGQRIRLVEMPHDPAPVPPGTAGTVTAVREFDPPIPSSYSRWEGGRAVETQLPAPATTHQIDVEWDNGSTLSLCVPGDRYYALPQGVREPNTNERY